MIQDNSLLDIKRLANFIGRSKRTVYRLINNKQIPAMKVGGKWAFDLEIIRHKFINKMLKNYTEFDQG